MSIAAVYQKKIKDADKHQIVCVTSVTNIASAQPEPPTEVEYEAAFKRLLAEIKSINDIMAPGEQMHSDRCEIERLKAETQVLKDETRALLASMGAKL